MKMEQKQKQVRKQDEDEVTVEPVSQEEAREVSGDAADVLDDIDCCLAENTPGDAAGEAGDELKAQARAEYDEIMKNYSWTSYQAWMGKYEHLFAVSCCGSPDIR